MKNRDEVRTSGRKRLIVVEKVGKMKKGLGGVGGLYMKVNTSV